MPEPTIHRSRHHAHHRPPRARWRRTARLLACWLPLALMSACAAKPKRTCNPEQHAFEQVRVLVSPTEAINPRDDGESLSVVLQLYELTAPPLEALDFDALWQSGGKEAFGASYVAEHELTIYPNVPAQLELTPSPQTKHLLAVAMFRKPTGRSWYRTFALPRFHGESVCRAQSRQEPWPDPCFFVLVDGYRLSGGHVAPSGFDSTRFELRCPGPPLETAP